MTIDARAKRVLRKTAVLIVKTLSLTGEEALVVALAIRRRALCWRCESSRRVASLSFSFRSDNFRRFAFDEIADRERFLGGTLTVYRRVCCNDNFLSRFSQNSRAFVTSQ